MIGLANAKIHYSCGNTLSGKGQKLTSSQTTKKPDYFEVQIILNLSQSLSQSRTMPATIFHPIIFHG